MTGIAKSVACRGEREEHDADGETQYEHVRDLVLRDGVLAQTVAYRRYRNAEVRLKAARRTAAVRPTGTTRCDPARFICYEHSGLRHAIASTRVWRIRRKGCRYLLPKKALCNINVSVGH